MVIISTDNDNNNNKNKNKVKLLKYGILKKVERERAST